MKQGELTPNFLQQFVPEKPSFPFRLSSGEPRTGIFGNQHHWQKSHTTVASGTNDSPEAASYLINLNFHAYLHFPWKSETRA